MKIFNTFVLSVGAAVTFFGAAAFPFKEDFKSAGVVPLFTKCVVRDGAMESQRECLLYKKRDQDGITLIADWSTERLFEGDSADTAAWIFFSRQLKYETVQELAQALRTSATKVHMGNHITYFLEFDAQDLSDINFVRGAWNWCDINRCTDQSDGTFFSNSRGEFEPWRNDVVIVHGEDLKQALNYGWQKRCSKGCARDVHVQDTLGRSFTILDGFLVGLTDNYSKIKHLFV